MRQNFHTKPARPAAPPLARASSAVFALLARKTKFMDPALAESWPQLAGERLAALCRPGRLTGSRQGGRTLELHVASGAAAAEVQMEADGLLKRVNAYLGPGAVARIAVLQSGGRGPSPDGDGPAPVGGAAALQPPDSGPLGDALASLQAAARRRSGGE